MKNQAKVTLMSLYKRGYKPCQAARIIGRKHQHVCAVLSGARKSAKLHILLSLLPERECPGKETPETLTAAKEGFKQNLIANGFDNMWLEFLKKGGKA